MTAAFQPADGERARWRYAYDLVVSKKPGEDVTLLELAELLELDANADAQVLRGVMLQAKKHLEEAKQQTVRTVPKFGWVVLDARGNLPEIEGRRKKAYRATTRTARLIVATDRTGLSPIERQRLDFETRNVLGASSLFGRKTKSFVELERESASRSQPQLPLAQESA